MPKDKDKEVGGVVWENGWEVRGLGSTKSYLRNSHGDISVRKEVAKELSEDLNSIKKTQSETKDTLIEIKNNLQGNNSEVDEAENQINNLEHKEAKINQSEQEEKRIQKNEDSVRSLWNNFKHTNIWVIGVLEGEVKEQEIENLFEK